MCRPRVVLRNKGESRSSKARSLASRKFVSKTGWLACCCCLCVRAYVCGYYECVDVEPVAPRCCCCCCCGRLMEKCSVPLEARCEQTSTKYAGQKRAAFLSQLSCLDVCLYIIYDISSQQMFIRSASASDSDPTELRFHGLSSPPPQQLQLALVPARVWPSRVNVLSCSNGNINGDEAMRR